MKSDIGNNRVFVNEHGVIEIDVVGDQTVDSVQVMADRANRLCLQHRKQGKPALVLDNLVEMGKVPPEARRRVVDLAKSMAYDKFAMHGKHKLLRLGANLMMQAIGKGDSVRYFEDYDQAIAWLKSK